MTRDCGLQHLVEDLIIAAVASAHDAVFAHHDRHFDEIASAATACAPAG